MVLERQLGELIISYACVCSARPWHTPRLKCMRDCAATHREHEDAWASWRDPEGTHMDEARFMPVIDKKWSQLVKANKSARRNGMSPLQQPNTQQQRWQQLQQQQQQQKHMMLGTRSKAKND